MGRKFASMHIRENKKVNVLSIVSEKMRREQSFNSDANLEAVNDDTDTAEEKFSLAYFNNILKKCGITPDEAFLQSTVYYKIEDGFINLFSEEFAFDNICDIASLFFSDYDIDVLTVGYFDDDVLELAVQNRGKIKSRIVLCNAPDVYGYVAVKNEYGAFLEMFDISEEKLLGCRCDSYYETLMNISNMIGLSIGTDICKIKRDISYRSLIGSLI